MCGWTQAQKDPKGKACWIRSKAWEGLGTNHVGRTTWLQVQKDFLAPKVWEKELHTTPSATVDLLSKCSWCRL